MTRIQMPIRWVLNRIEQAKETEMDAIIKSLLKCYGKIHPDYELAVVSLPKQDTRERCAEIDKIAAALKKEKYR